MRPNFENASEVESCLTDAKINFENRQPARSSETDVRSEVPEAYDFDKNLDRNKLDSHSLLAGKVQTSIVDKFRCLQEPLPTQPSNGASI